MTSFDLFLSYHHSDRESVEKVRQILNTRGVSTFIDYKNLDLGLPWPQRLEQSLQSVRAVLVFVGAEMGRWQKREMYFALDLQTEREQNGNLFPVIPILLRGADLTPGFLFLNSWVDLRDDLTSPDAIDRLVHAVSGKPGPEPAPEPMPVSPYRELRAFSEEHSAFFYGRERLSKHLLEKVCGEKGLVAVIGPSGSGKSSVVHAGLLPLLRRQRPPAKTWDAISFKPDGDPFNRMARALVPLLEPDMSEIDRSIELTKLEKALRSGDTRLADLVARILEKSKGTDRFLIIIDQFEELITLQAKSSATDPNGDDSVSFVKVMMAAINARAPLEFVVTLRADFYGDIIGLNRELSDRLEQSLVNVGAMDSAELESAIVIPARKVGLDFEHGLVQRLVNDVGHEPGQLPLLQFALWELWEKRQVQARLMTHAAYDKFGGVAKAINTVAHTKLASLNSVDQKSVRRIFTRLVRVTPRGEGGEARRRASLDEFNGPERKLISQFVDARLLVTLRDENTSEESVEVSHEALIREWDDLVRWLNEDREFLLWRQRLRVSLAEWQRLNADEGALLRGALLTEAESWRGRREDDLNEDEREYIDTGKQRLQKETLEANQRRMRQRRNRALAFVAIAIVATLALVQWDRAATARRIAQARSLLSPAVLIANNEPGKLDQAALLAIESLRLDDTPEAQSILRQAVAALPSEIDRIRIDCDGEASLSPQGKYVVCINNARRSVKLISLSTRKDERAPVTESEAISMAAASPDGKFLAVGLGSGGFHLFNDHGQVVARFENPRTDRSPDPDDIPDALVAFSANGQRFAAGVVSGKKTAIHVFELARPEDRPSLFAINFPVFALTFSPEAGFLAALHEGQSETGVTIFDLTTNKELRTIRGGAAFRSLALSGGARVIAVPTVDSSIRIKNTDLVETVYGELKHQQDVNAVALTPDGMYAASGSEDGTARVMEIQGRPVALLPTGSPVQSVAFTQDFNLAVLSGDTVRIVNVFFGRPGFETKALNGAAIGISPRGRYLTSLDTKANEYVWVLDRTLPKAEPLKLSLTGFSAAAETISSDSIRYSNDEGYLFIGNSRAGLASYKLTPFEPEPLQSPPDGSFLHAISGDGHTVAWATPNDIKIARRGKTEKPIPQAKTGVLELNSDGTLIAVAGAEDSTLSVYNVFTQASTKVEASARILKAQFSPDGRYLAVASDDKMLSLADSKSGTILWRLATGTTLLVFSSDGNMLVAGGAIEGQQARDLYVIDTATAEPITIRQQTRPLGAAFDPSGLYLDVMDSTSITRHYLRTTDLIQQTCSLLTPRSAQGWKTPLPSGASSNTCPGLQ